jgi:hypothetical protein
LSNCRNRDRRCSIVASLPKRGANPATWVPSAARTYCEVSDANSLTHIKTRDRMTSLSISLQKPIHE